MPISLLARCVATLALVAPAAALAAPAPADAASKECMTRQFRGYDAKPAGSVRVLHAPGLGKAAAAVATEARRTYPKFKALLKREPPSDARERCFHGPDGKLDVYVTKAKRFGPFKPPKGAVAFVHPYDADEVCLPKKPVFAVVRPGVRRAILAHELYHAFQAAYATRQGCHIYSEWNEALATWAGNYAYPKDDIEHHHDGALTKPDLPIHAWGYATWVFPYYLTQTHGAGVIRGIEESREKHLNDIHVDKAIPGGFAERFPDFSVYAYNRAPVPGVPGIASTFGQWDALAAAPQSVPSISLAKGDNPLPMERLRVLSREYRRIDLADTRLRKIEFHNPQAADPDLHVRALVRRADGSWTSENWDGRTTVELCRDEPGEDVREIILAYSNSSLDRKVAPATRFQAEESCSMRFRILETRIDHRTNASADHILCGRQSGRIAFSGSGGAQDSTGTPIEFARGRVGGSIEGYVSGGWSGHHLEACKMIPSKQACSVDMPPVAPRPDGRWPISFEVRGGADDPTWTLDWGFDSPEVGFVDAGEEECYVHIWGYFDNEASRREVPRATFMQATPFTVTFEGSGTATNTPNNTSAIVNHEWRYSVTLQRVG